MLAIITVAVVGMIAAAVLVAAAIRPTNPGSPAPFAAGAGRPEFPGSTTSGAPDPPAVVVTVPTLPTGPASAEPLATLPLDVTPPANPAVKTTGSPKPISTSSISTSFSSTRSGTAAPTSTGTAPPTRASAAVTTLSTAVAKVPARYAHPLGWVGGGKVVTLTFDDGPSQYTGQVLDVLDRYGVKATFCQIGQQVGWYPAVEKRIAADGHTFCNHSWDHDEALPVRSVAVIDAEITRTQQAIRSAGGVAPRYYRAPGGDWGATPRLRIELARLHVLPLAWAVDSLDWTRPGVAAIVKNVLTTVTPGAIILLHDGGGNRAQTLAALPKIIAGLTAAGYRFVVLPRNPPQ